MHTDTVSIEKFAADNAITISSVYVDRNPHMDDSERMNNYKVTSYKPQGRTARKGRMTLYFSKGFGLSGEPTTAEVLDCLASDAAGVENAKAFEDWCDEYGYDADSRKAEKTFKAVQHSTARLKTFLGDGLYGQLLWNTDRL